MSPIKVGLVQINNSFADSCYLPYSVGILQAYFQKYAKTPEFFQFIQPIYHRMPVAEAVARLKKAAIVAFSTYVWNYRISLEIAKQIKENNPDVLILFGGPHVPNESEAFLREYPFIDLACHGEGEIVFLNILENYRSRNWEAVPSISYLDEDTFYRNPRVPRIKDLSNIPSPYLEGTFDEMVREINKHQWLGLWETNRGCPFSCTYCDWGATIHSKLYTFEMARLEREIDWLAKNQIEFVFCCDANFGILRRDLDIVRHFAKAKKEQGYPKALSVQNTKNATERSYAVHEVLSEAGLSKGVNLALQTIDETTLKNVGRQNISLKSFQELQVRFNQDGIETFTDIILALPGETYNTFADGVAEIIENGQHHRIQFINLSVLPNAPMADPAYIEKHGIISVQTKMINAHGSLAGSEDGIDETQELVIATNAMPKKDWVKTRAFSWMTSFLYFDKVLQIPFMLLHAFLGFNYRELVELFMVQSSRQYPIVSEINEFFTEEARNIQRGGPEFCRSYDWLNIYWPHDEYVLIKLFIENRLTDFYEEARTLLSKMLKKKSIGTPPFLDEAFMLNMKLMKRPFQAEDISLRMKFNIWDFFQYVRNGKKCLLERGDFVYHIDCTSESWHTWEDWLKQVIWYGHKRATYLYKVNSIEKKTVSVDHRYSHPGPS